MDLTGGKTQDFLKKWFEGFDKGLTGLDEEALALLFEHTSKACISQTGTQDKYVEIMQQSENTDDFFIRLGQIDDDIKTLIIKKKSVYEVRYLKCFCPMHRDFAVNNPKLCACTKKAMEYNLGAVFGKDRAKVQLLDSILMGGAYCAIRIEI